MKLVFALSLLSLLTAQVTALVFERLPEHARLITSLPLVSPAGLSPAMLAGLGVLLFTLFFARLRREPGPLAAGSFVTGLGHVGLQITAIEALKSHVADPVGPSVAAFVLAAGLGSWRALRRRNEDDSMAMIAYFISCVAAVAFSFFVLSHFGSLSAPAYVLAAGGAFLGALPAYFSARACATQVLLIRPGGGRALTRVLLLHAFGGIWGGIIFETAALAAGVNYAAALVAGFYLLAAWLYTQGKSSPFEGVLLSPSA